MMKRAIFGLALVLTLFLAYQGLKILLVNGVDINRPDAVSIPFFPKPRENSFNALLLGFAGGNHDGAYLTDTIMVAHINPDSKKILLLSLPRDLWVNVPSVPAAQHMKINAAWAKGFSKDTEKSGFEIITKTVETVTGLPVRYAVAVDFDGFAKAIDALGGVEVEVPKSFDDEEYPIAGKETDLCGRNEEELPELLKVATESAIKAFPCRYELLHFDGGTQLMNGERALKFVRSRHSQTEGSDFSRTQRQRNFLVAVKNKVFAIGFLPKIPALYQTLRQHIVTDVSPNDIEQLLKIGVSWNTYEISSIGLTQDNLVEPALTDDKQFALLPREGLDEWNAVRQWISHKIMPSVPLAAPVITLMNRSSGRLDFSDQLARLRDNHLIAYENSVRNWQKPTQGTTITLHDGNIDPKVIQILKKEFPDAVINVQEGTASEVDITIVVGNIITPTVTPSR